MKQGWLASGTLMLGIFSGVLLAPAVRGIHASTSSPDLGRNRAEGDPDGHGDGGSGRHIDPRNSSPKRPLEPRVSVPLDKVAKVLQDDLLYSFNTYDGRPGFDTKSIDQALVLMDASDREKDDIHATFDTLGKKLWEAEKGSIKVRKSGQDGVELSLTGFVEASKPILDSARQDLKSAMPGPRGEILANALPWSKIRFGSSDDDDDDSGKTPRDMSIGFQIVRDKDGIRAWLRVAGGSTGSLPQPGGYKDDGTPIPADKVFDPIWQPWLSGVTLLPIDQNP